MRPVRTFFAATLILWSQFSLAANAWFSSLDNNPKPVLYRDPYAGCFRGVIMTIIDSDRASAPATAQYKILASVVQDEQDGGDYQCQGVIYRRSGPGTTNWTIIPYVGEALIISMPNSSNPKCNDSCCEPGGCSTNGSNPIQTSTGNKHQVETDFLGTGPYPIEFARTYDSNRSIEQAIGPLGAGWSHSYGGYIVGIGPSPYTQAVVYRPDGRILNFQIVSGVWQGDPDVSERLTYTENDGTNTNAPQWTLTTNDDEVEVYDGMGLLQSIKNRGGLAQTLSYINSSLRNTSQVQKVTDPVGRTLSFGYNGNKQIISVTDGNGAVIQYGYTNDGNNNLQTITYPDLIGTKVRTYYYNEAGQTAGVSQPYALTGIQDENNQRFASWGYDSSGRAVLSVHGAYSGGTIDRTGFVFNADGTVTVTDALSQARNFTFQNIYNVKRYTILDTPCDYCGTIFTSLGYDANGYPNTATDFRGYQTTFTHTAVDGSGHFRGLETQRDEAVGLAEERITNTSWNANFRVPNQITVLNHANAIEQRTDWAYNSRGQPVARCSYPDPTNTYICSASSAPASNSGIRRWVYTYCDAINTATPDPIGGVGENLGKGCPLVGLLRRIDGPRLQSDAYDWTTYQYYLTTDSSTPPKYRAGDLNQIIDALGHVTTYSGFDGNGRATQMVDSNGIATSMSYHPRGWLRLRTVCANANCSPSANDATTQTDYDGVGNTAKITQPDGVFFTYTFDNAHRLTNITDNLGDHVDYVLDAIGHRTAEKTFDVSDAINPRRLATSQYNTLSRLIDQYDAQARDTHFTFDNNGNRTDQTDPLGVKTHWDFDALNRLKDQIGDYQGTDSSTANSTVGYSFDTRDNITSTNDPNNLPTAYTFDKLNNLTSLQSPDTGTTSYPTYDEAGNRKQQTDNRGITWNYTFDALNRITGITYPTASLNVSFRYDNYITRNPCFATSYPLGRLTSMTDDTGATTYCYDLRGNVIEKIQVTHGYRFDTRYGYNTADRLMTITYPSGAQVNYSRDTDGRIQAVSITPSGGAATSILTSVTWQPFGPPITYTFAQNGQTLTKTFDQNYWMTDVTGSALNLHFCRDAAGNIMKLASAAPACTVAPSEQYAYDNLYRITHVRDGAGSNLQDFTYNLTGDRQTKMLDPSPAQTYLYAPNTHRLASVAAVSRDYDPNGNTTATASGQLPAFTFDDRNRMTQVHTSHTNGSPPLDGYSNYDYNGRGERVFKDSEILGIFHNHIADIGFVYNETGQLIGEYLAGSGTVPTVEYVYVDGTPIAYLIAGTLYYIHTDQLGSPRAVTSTGGTSQWNWPWQTNPFGETAATGTLTLNLRYAGQYADSETGLFYNMKRDYESGTGRYTESDPIGLLGGVATYAYVRSMPMRATDIFGLRTDEECCGAARNLGLQYLGGKKAGGMTICCEGRHVACVGVPVDPGAGQSILEGCIKTHEQGHFPDIDCPKCKPGKHPPPTRPPFRHPENQGMGECAGSIREVVCLRDANCGGDAACNARVQQRIAQIVAYGNGSGFNCGLQ